MIAMDERQMKYELLLAQGHAEIAKREHGQYSEVYLAAVDEQEMWKKRLYELRQKAVSE